MANYQLGKIIDSFSLDGSVKALSTTSFAMERYKEGNKVLLYNPNNNTYTSLTVVSFRENDDLNFIKFKEITTKEDALALKGCYLEIDEKDATLPSNYYHYNDLEGCKVVDDNNHELGIVILVEDFPAQITLRVKRQNNKQFMVPFIQGEFIKEVDIKNKIIHIHLMEGML